MAAYALVLQGYVVVAPDYQGLGVEVDTTGRSITHLYLSFPSHATGVFFAVRAAQAAFKPLFQRVIIVGHSQDGVVVWAVAQRQAIRPVERYLGAVAGYPVTNFVTQTDVQQGNAGYIGGLLIRGFQSLFPNFNISSVLTAEGARRFNLAAETQGCNPVFSVALSTRDVYQDGWQHQPHVELYRNMTAAEGSKFSGPLLVV
ncbi:MAG: hypothetical protein LQ343_007870 [Gyalolechia ehrenbergii]|nr:MAG: hypothetical protein LQ343_007870 [Gyalolechia ehrenbergii]